LRSAQRAYIRALIYDAQRNHIRALIYDARNHIRALIYDSRAARSARSYSRIDICACINMIRALIFAH
jgi:hypothetical protein